MTVCNNSSRKLKKLEQPEQPGYVPLTDAHAHIGSDSEIADRIRSQIPSLVCAVNPVEAKKLNQIQELLGDSHMVIPSYGLHPWYANQNALKDMQPFLEQSKVIGEIGMDSVWCEVPLRMQWEIFEYQLVFASANKKPVILHTKGQEEAIANLIGSYPNSYLVHWYSCEAHQANYRELDCYFSIGPDIRWNPAVQKLAQNVPSDRILIETDGMGAVRWAYEEASTKQSGINLSQIPETVEEALKNMLEVVAAIRGIEQTVLAEQIRANFFRFCYKH